MRNQRQNKNEDGIVSSEQHLSFCEGAARVLARCEELARCSETPANLTRTFLSPAMNEAHELLGGWMREAGMTPRVDEMGNLLGHYPASSDAGGVWWLGSHIDTVPNAGFYDGALGVLLAIEVVSRLGGERLPFALKVVGFSEEEGVRFKTPYLGSRAITGLFDPQFLELRDENEISMRQAMCDFGLVPDEWRRAHRWNGKILGYLEAHIEQGPVLESRGAPLGIVTEVVGQSRLTVRFAGQAGHAGTQPMNGRQDALCATAQWIMVVETLARETPGAVATVGAIDARPNTPNVVAGEVVCSLDVRHADDTVREKAVETLLAQAQDVARRRNICFEVLAHSSQKAVPMNTRLQELLHTSCENVGVKAPPITSGAGHDAVIMARMCACAMLFVRSPGGASHCPDEAVIAEDVALALGAMNEFLRALAREGQHLDQHQHESP